MSFAARLARDLESGAHDGPLASLASRAWSALATSRVARPLRFAKGACVIAIGGSTLGGSGKTPVAIAIAASLAARGARVAIVGHAYRARVLAPRRVLPDDRLAHVGDEALLAARALASYPSASVVVAASRQAALDYALRESDVAILDGVAQTLPHRATLALLAVDAFEPWGRAAACPPRGDLRAPRDALLAACDRVVAVVDPFAAAFSLLTLAPVLNASHRSLASANVRSTGADLGGRLVPWSELRALRIGLVTSLGRPARVVEHLARRGIAPAIVVSALDHAPLSARLLRRAAAAPIDLWLASPKCALHLSPALSVSPLESIGSRAAQRPPPTSRFSAADAPTFPLVPLGPPLSGPGGIPLAVIDYRIDLDPSLIRALPNSSAPASEASSGVGAR